MTSSPEPFSPEPFSPEPFSPEPFSPASRSEYAPTLTRDDYVSPGVFELERRHLFHAGWFYVGHVASVPPGTSRVFDVVGENVIVTCDRSGQLHAFANACRHRGAMLLDPTDPTVVAPECGAASIRCPYHAWTYGLDGRLLSTPRVDHDDVDRAAFGLWAYRVDVWNGLVFVCLNPDAQPLHGWLLETNPDLVAFKHLRIPEMALIRRTRSAADANWKVLMENYQECLHCPIVHPELVDAIPHYRTGSVADPARPDGSVELSDKSGGYVSATTGTPALPALPGLSPADDGVYQGVSVFPNLLFDLTATGLVLTALFPVAADRSQLVSEYLFASEVGASTDYDPTAEIAFNERITAQDNVVCERVQRGVASNAFSTGILTTKDALVAAFNQQYRTALDTAMPTTRAFSRPVPIT
jgi:glycine betaine catabolism A